MGPHFKRYVFPTRLASSDNLALYIKPRSASHHLLCIHALSPAQSSSPLLTADDQSHVRSVSQLILSKSSQRSWTDNSPCLRFPCRPRISRRNRPSTMRRVGTAIASIVLTIGNPPGSRSREQTRHLGRTFCRQFASQRAARLVRTRKFNTASRHAR